MLCTTNSATKLRPDKYFQQNIKIKENSTQTLIVFLCFNKNSERESKKAILLIIAFPPRPKNKPNKCNERFLQWKSSNTPLFWRGWDSHLLFIVCFHGKCICGVYVCILKGSLYGYVQAGQPWVVFTSFLRQGFPLNLELALGWLVDKFQGFSTTTSPPQPLDTRPHSVPRFHCSLGLHRWCHTQILHRCWRF